MKHPVTAAAIAGFVCLLSTSAMCTSYSSERGTARVYADTPDFSIAITPVDVTVVQGATTSCTVSVAPANGFSGMVSLNAIGFGSGASGTFNPPSISGAGSSTLTVTTTGTAQTGSFTLTIMGSSGSLLHTTMATLTINPVGGISERGTAVHPFVTLISGNGI